MPRGKGAGGKGPIGLGSLLQGEGEGGLRGRCGGGGAGTPGARLHALARSYGRRCLPPPPLPPPNRRPGPAGGCHAGVAAPVQALGARWVPPCASRSSRGAGLPFCHALPPFHPSHPSWILQAPRTPPHAPPCTASCTHARMHASGAAAAWLPIWPCWLSRGPARKKKPVKTRAKKPSQAITAKPWASTGPRASETLIQATWLGATPCARRGHRSRTRRSRPRAAGGTP